jgi:hypothetical protein
MILFSSARHPNGASRFIRKGEVEIHFGLDGNGNRRDLRRWGRKFGSLSSFKDCNLGEDVDGFEPDAIFTADWNCF